MAETPQDKLLDAALPHVAFDGWSAAAFDAACADIGMAPTLARAYCPRGAVDLAVAYHRRGDHAMIAALAAAETGGLRFRDRIALAVRLRLDGADREIVRRGAALFALPQHATTGAALIWGTADAIWTALGDTSDDINWYSKRATLSAVYSATVLYWMGDDSEDHAATWGFLDRRIEGVMRFETFKARVRDNPLLSKMLSGPLAMIGRIRAPVGAGSMPGHVKEGERP
jgi:ubiquinone biosynthesis protein COQ9